MVLLSGPVNGIWSMITGRHVASSKPEKTGELA